MRSFFGKVFSLFFLAFIWLSTCSFNYSKAWKDVRDTIETNPKTALNIISQVEKAARKEGNNHQLLACIIKTEEAKQTIHKGYRFDPTITTETVKKLQKFRITHKQDKVLVALSNFLEAYVLNDFYWHSSGSSKKLSGVPDRLDEWSRNIFEDTIHALVNKAINEPATRTEMAANYVGLVETEADGKYFNPTIYDMIMGTCLEKLGRKFDDKEKYDLLVKWTNSHRNDKDLSTYIYLKVRTIIDKDTDIRLKELRDLLKKYQQSPASVYIRYKLADEYYYKYRRREGEQHLDSLVEVCTTGMAMFPNHPHINDLKEQLDRVNNSSCNISFVDNTIGRYKKIRLKVTYANLTDLKLKLYRYDCKPIEWAYMKKDSLKKSLIKQYSFALQPTHYLVSKDTILELEGLDYGPYGLYYKDKTLSFEVSDLLPIIGSNIIETLPIIVVDAKTGYPRPDIEVTATFQKRDSYYGLRRCFKHNDEMTTDKNGYAKCNIYSDSWYHQIDFVMGDNATGDKYKTISTPNDKGSYDCNSENYIDIFTDRSIYRPSQTVHFKLLSYEITKKENHINEFTKIHVSIKDRNGIEVYSKTLTTNKYGSASDSLLLPANAKLGDYSIHAKRADTHRYGKFKVEEYKRPNFEIEINKPKESYVFGEKAVITGKAMYLDDTPVQNANVKCMIRYSDVKFDSIKTDQNGNFKINFLPTTSFDNISIQVTDANGESHEKSSDIRIYNKRLDIGCPNTTSMTFDRLQDSYFSVANMDGFGLERAVSYKIYKDSSLVDKGSVVSDSILGFKLPLKTDSLTSGRYNFQFVVLDSKGDSVVKRYCVVLYRTTDKRPPVFSNLWTDDNEMGFHFVDNTKENVYRVHVGTSLHNAYLIVFRQNWRSTRWCKADSIMCYHLDNEIREFQFSLEEFNNHKSIDFFLVHDGVVEKAHLTLQKKIEVKKLPMRLSVFRDKVEVGSKEAWKISIPKKELKAINTTPDQLELLSTMYDASLDKIYPHSWDFDPQYRESFSIQKWLYNQPLDKLYYEHPLKNNAFSVHLNLWNLIGELPSRSVSYDEKCDYADNTIYIPDAPTEEAKEKNSSVKVKSIEEKAKQKMVVRSNFSETAFFYPHTYFDKKGDAEIAFTMPDQMTRWKFMAIAHSTNGWYASIIQEIVSQKRFSIVPNYPRFLRHGDTCTFTAKVSNWDSVSHYGKAKLLFINPANDSLILEKEVSFEVESNQNKAVAWEIAIPEDVDAVIMRVQAQDDKYSDAEQKLLPILSDRITLTQTLPMYVRGGQTKEYSFSNLVNDTSSTLKINFLKFELCPNPAWMAVKCLPSLANKSVFSAIGHSSKLYALRLSEKIMKKNPTIFRVIKEWKDSSNTNKQSLLSNLYKNEEVKNILLDESPWLLQAKNETEQYEQLSTLLDISNLKITIDEEKELLKNYRKYDGGYKWLCGFPEPSFYVTLFVLDNYIRLINAGFEDFRKWDLIEDCHFLDNWVYNEYIKLKKKPEQLKNYQISMLDLYYLQVRSAFRNYDRDHFEVEKPYTEAYNYLKNLVKTQWPKCSLYGKALGAIALQQDSDHVDALKIVNSLREFSVTTDEMGTYWPSNKSSWFWEDDAISTHTRLMEALQMVSPIPEEQDNLKIWLINQKRTQDWGNVIATVEALNVMLMDGRLLDQPNKVTAVVGGETIEPTNAEPGTGTFSKTYGPKQVTPQMGKVKLSCEEGGNIAFGGMYWQFEEQMDKVKSNQTGLSVNKQVMLQTENNVLTPVSNNTQLNVGDKLVIRLVVRSDRDFEYVCLKDQRASCLEPLQQLSGYYYSQGVGYYQMPRDAAMYYFFDHLPKGTYIFEYPLYVTHKGNYCNGITNIQCLYAPEFSSNTGSVRINVGK